MTGIVELPAADKLITVSDQGQVVVSSLKSGEQLQSFCALEHSRYALKTLMELPERKAVLATDYSGKIHIWGYEPDV